MIRLEPTRALRPARWGAAVVVTCVLVGWRLLAWQARDALGQPDAAAGEALLGVLGDMVVAIALLAIARRLSHHRVATALLLGTGSLGITLIRALDAGHCYLTGAHFRANGFSHLDPDYLGLLAVGDSWFIAAGWAGSAVVLLLALLREAQAAPRQPITLPMALLIGLWLTGLISPASPYSLGLSPEANFLGEYVRYRAAGTAEPGLVAPLSKDLRQRLAAVGLAPPSSPDPMHPLLREDLGEAVLVTDAPAPNIVLTLVEALNDSLLADPGQRFDGLMPNLSALRGRMSRVDGYVGTSSPTILALVAALCSLHPPTNPMQLHRGKGEQLQDRTAYTCIADRLREAGYRTVYVQGAKKGFARKGQFLSSHGFDEVHGRAELIGRFPNRGTSSWGAWDSDLVEYTLEQIERLEALRAEDGRPFFLAMLTLDSHQPGMVREQCTLPTAEDGTIAVVDMPGQGDGAHRLLQGYHCTDRALAPLAEQILDTPRRDHTLWAISGDHVQFALAPTRAIFGRGYNGSFGHVPLLIHDPRHDLPARVHVVSGTIDLAPTILHLAGVTDLPHSMTGASIFGRRKQIPVNIGRVGSQRLYVGTRDQQRTLSFKRVRKACEEDLSLFGDRSAPLSACDLMAWSRWHDELWAKRRLFPQDRYTKIPQRFIAHAGGGLGDEALPEVERVYTNSLDALNENYARGFRFFELDFQWTSDERLVLLHDWGYYFTKHHSTKPAPGRLDANAFNAWPFGFEALDLETLLAWLAGHRDAHVITDFKQDNLRGLEQIGEAAGSLKTRFIPQIYDFDEYDAARALGYRDLILTLYRLRSDDETVLDFARRHPLLAVAMPLHQARTRLPLRLREHGIFVYVHTLNDPAVISPLWQEDRIDGVYTDFVPPTLELPERVRYVR